MSTPPTNGFPKPLIVQGDRTIFVEVTHPDFEKVRDRLMAFAELEKSPEYVHIYRVSPLSLWNAAAAGESAEGIVQFLETQGRYPVPANLQKEIREFLGRYGQLKLVAPRRGAGGAPEELELVSEKRGVLEELAASKMLREYFTEEKPAVRPARTSFEKGPLPSLPVRPECRGVLKVALIKLGYPVEDLAGYRDGAPLEIRLRDKLPCGSPFQLRGYQRGAIDSFHAGGSERGGNGVIVLPCGAGKTVVAIGILERVQCHALIISTNINALKQWRRELLDKTELRDEDVGEYTSEEKVLRPITLTTYQMLTYRKRKLEALEHFKIFTAKPWGIIIYDEVHLLPAPVFRLAAELQATRRLGLTATLVREDGKEDEVYSLIGPRKYDVPWRVLEAGGWIAAATCVEYRVDLTPEEARDYAATDNRTKIRIASESVAKLGLLKHLLAAHRGDRVLILGQYIDQLKRVRNETGAPIITGKTPTAEREALYERFRLGEVPVLIVSKVGNFAIDLPEANVAIQVSGTFGSRQEEAQRLGRILRPKKDGGNAMFYSIVSRATRDQEFSEKRQLFLTEQGYQYSIREESSLSLGTPSRDGCKQDSA